MRVREISKKKSKSSGAISKMGGGGSCISIAPRKKNGVGGSLLKMAILLPFSNLLKMRRCLYCLV